MKWPNITAATAVRELIRRAVREDVGVGDITTLSLIRGTARAQAAVVSHGEYVISGIAVAAAVFKHVDRRLKCSLLAKDGQRIGKDDHILRIAGSARGILTAERTALNFMQRMTGIATLTARFVDQVGPCKVMILDTRKTTPGLRQLEKYAVLCGGGANHRMGLHDMILIKDNHRRLWKDSRGRNLADAVRQARSRYPHVPLEIEVTTEAELKDAIRAEPDWILLDNMSPKQIRRCVPLRCGKTRFEASGGVRLANVREIASSGVDAISIGSLTHSAPAADLSLEVL